MQHGRSYMAAGRERRSQATRRWAMEAGSVWYCVAPLDLDWLLRHRAGRATRFNNVLAIQRS